MSSTAEISPEDRHLLTELRKQIKKELELCPQFDDDFSLMRWLVGWDRKLDVIIPKIVFSIRACNSLGLNKMDLKTIEKVTKACDESSQALQYLPGSLIGFDKEDYIVYLDVMGRLQASELVRCIKTSDLYIMKIVESYGIMEILRDKEKELGRPLGSAIIFDLEGLGFSQLTTVNQFTPVISLLQDMFPDVVRKFYVINAPTFIQILYKMVSPVIAKQTREKLRILGSDYKDVLRKEIGEDVLFEHWGGTRQADSKYGNIKMGGKLDEDLYYDGTGEIPEEKLSKLTVPAGKTISVPIKLEGKIPGRKLSWWWSLDSGDILFSVLRAADGHESELEHPDDYMCWPKFKLMTNYVPETGEISAEEPGTYKFLFENDGYFWSKTVRYSIEIRMTHSLCSTVTAFCGVEILLSLMAIYFVAWHPSHQCLAIQHETALHVCEPNGSVAAASAKHLAQDLFSSPNNTKEIQDILASRLQPVESVACQEMHPLMFHMESGPVHAIFWLPYFFLVNALLCLTLVLRHRTFRLGKLYNFLEATIVVGLTAMVLSGVLYLQYREQQAIVSFSSSSSTTSNRGMILHPPANWGATYSIAFVTLAWKVVQIAFHAITGSEKKISVEHPVFKIFDFSKNYKNFAETEA